MTTQTQRQQTDQDKLYPEILYYGKYGFDGQEVYKRLWPDGESQHLALEPSLKVEEHSLTGFRWGGSGSGCAQLALALLLDATSDPGTAKDWYFEFEHAFVSGWKKDWEIKRSQILDWLKSMEARDLQARQNKN